MSDCFFNTRKIRNARLILNRTNQSIFCTSSAPMSVSSALFCTAAIPNVTDIAMHILCASRRTCSTTYSLILHTLKKRLEGTCMSTFLSFCYVVGYLVLVLFWLLLFITSALIFQFCSGDSGRNFSFKIFKKKTSSEVSE